MFGVMSFKHWGSGLVLIGALTGCGTMSDYTPQGVAGQPKPGDYPIYVYPEELTVPRPYAVVGSMFVGETLFTIFGGSFEEELNTLRQKARRVGADAVKITSIQQPDFLHAKHRVEAELIRFTQPWESLPMDAAELRQYLRADRDFDPIEGFWRIQDPGQTPIGIVASRSKPGRDFVAFLLAPGSGGWRTGDKKLDLARGERPGVYRGSYFFEDYRRVGVAFTLRPENPDSFLIQLSVDSVPLRVVREAGSAY